MDQSGRTCTCNWASLEGGERVTGIGGGKEGETQHFLYLAPDLPP